MARTMGDLQVVDVCALRLDVEDFIDERTILRSRMLAAPGSARNLLTIHHLSDNQACSLLDEHQQMCRRFAATGVIHVHRFSETASESSATNLHHYGSLR